MTRRDSAIVAQFLRGMNRLKSKSLIEKLIQFNLQSHLVSVSLQYKHAMSIHMLLIHVAI